MNISIFDLFNIGIGPSSSHCIGPMRAAKAFVSDLKAKHLFDKCYSISIDLYGSLAFTGEGHGTHMAIILGLAGYDAETVEPTETDKILAKVRDQRPKKHIFSHFNETLPEHSNGMLFKALDQDDKELLKDIYYSTGGGFIVKAGAQAKQIQLKYEFDTANELIELCKQNNKTIAEIVRENELYWRTNAEIDAQVAKIWSVMEQSIERGCHTTGILPGGLKVPRRAAELYKKLEGKIIDTSWLNIFAMAVNEENAAGGRVVTAPTNGAAGIVPAVLKYYREHYKDFSDSSLINFILTAGAIGLLYKKGASISGAEMGCQGEVGVASSMAAGALTAVLGGSVAQIEQAAEIAIEHNLGLTCDPIKGLVQIPCIERNAMGAVKAVNAATIALLEDGKHIVSLDNAIKTMRDTGRDMSSHYKETSQGGLAVNVPEC